jgi:hypothetical protein
MARDALWILAGRTTRRVVGFAAVLPLVALPETSQLETGAGCLRALQGLAIVAEDVASEVRALGLTESWLEARATEALRREGIAVLARSDALMDPHQPLLVVRLEALRFPGRQTYAWHLSTAVVQRVTCPADSAVRTLAQTWSAESVLGITSAKGLRGSVGETLELQLAELGRARAREASGQR